MLPSAFFLFLFDIFYITPGHFNSLEPLDNLIKFLRTASLEKSSSKGILKKNEIE